MIELPWAPHGWGQVATRCFCPNLISADNQAWNSRTFHFIRAPGVRGVRVAFAHWYAKEDDTGEANGVGTQTIKAAFEWPSGTRHALLFGGATTFGIPAGGTVISDYLPISPPNGAKVFIHARRTGQTQVVYSQYPVPFVSGSTGDALNVGGADTVMTGTTGDDGFNLQMWPSAILAYTNTPSFALVGDSITRGLGVTTADATGDIGLPSRIIGGQWPYINLGASGETAGNFLASNAKRMALARYCSGLICALGTNDIGSITGAALAALNMQIQAKNGGRPMWVTTITPGTGTTERVNYNTIVRAVPNWIKGVLDVDAVVSTNGSTWNVGYSDDTIHPNNTGDASVVGAVPSAQLRTPGQGNYLPRIIYR